MKNVLYLGNVNAIGGVETVVYNICKKYTDRDITVMYKDGSSQQLYRLSKYAKLKKFDERPFTCERLFVNYGWEDIEDYAHVTVQGYNVIHANYDYINKTTPEWPVYVPDNGYINLAVSDWAGKNSGIDDYKVCYNPVTIEDDRKALLLVSATRIRPDKGKLKWRMETLTKRLEEREIPFLWLIFSEGNETINSINVINVPSRLNIFPYLKMADFVVQLSDSEACCMTALESESVGTPMVCTKIPSFYEQGLNDENAIFVDFDMSNVDEVIDKMVNKKFNFKFTPKKDIWDELIVGKREEELITMKKFKVKAGPKFLEGGGVKCNDIGRIPEVGEEFVVFEDRLEPLKEYIEVIGEIEEEPKEEPKKKGKKK